MSGVLNHFRNAAWFALFLMYGSQLSRAQTAQNFVSVTPCRIADTRNATGTFGGPIMAAGQTRTFIIPQSSCNIPSTATGFSLNVTVVPPTDYLGYLSIWPTGQSQPLVSTLNDDGLPVVANAAIVAAGSSNGTNGAINVYVTDQTHVILDIDGYFIQTPVGYSTQYSVAIGTNTSAAIGWVNNTALGANALSNASAPPNTSGPDENTAIGGSAMMNTTTGCCNSALGFDSLYANTTGDSNTAIGQFALFTMTTGNSNTMVGSNAGYGFLTGDSNTAIGVAFACNNGNAGTFTGSHNIAVGAGAGDGPCPRTGSYNIYIGSPITPGASDNGLVRIGNPSQQTATFIAGIRGVITGNSDGIPVVIDSNGQLGTVSSSRRFKKDIEDMGDATANLMRLRPVTYRYKQSFADGSEPIQYGLIAEEVDEVYPELVAHSADGQIESVKYQVLDSMLLNEIQRQQKKIDQQESTIRQLESRLAALEGSSKK